ncbi:MAG TPA: hypothetical protein VHC70_12240 [Phycisphaerales bacterium]|jgi:hypothetical protein|nr:hypothetical protein [Phycisphaerales bacterium]
MAIYKFERHLKCSSDSVYDTVLPAGSIAARSGIYRCDGCGFELTALEGQPLPGLDHHKHIASQKLIRWRLIVADSGAPGAIDPGAGAFNPVSRARRY